MDDGIMVVLSGHEMRVWPIVIAMVADKFEARNPTSETMTKI